MKLDNPALLKTIFSLKRNFAPGCAPSKKVFSGVEIAPFKGNAAAAVCISSDFEMSWAWRGRDSRAAEQRGIAERQNVPFILDLLNEYSIPITWATVGHLFLESCTRSGSGLAHANMPRPTVNHRFNGDWYLHDPCSNVGKSPLWYAPDLIQQVVQSRTPQEIGTHTFSHFNFSTKYSTADLVRSEMDACIDVMRPFGVRPRSLVFPQNVMEYSYLPLLAETGITSVRHRDEEIRLSYPERTDSGVYKIYESMNLRVARHYDYAEKAKIFIRKAMERRAAYSLWFHPSDPKDLFDTEFRRILQYVDTERNAGRLWVTSMGDLAAYCEAREQMQLHVDRQPKAITVSFVTSFDASRYGRADVSVLIPVSSRPESAQVELVSGERKSITVGFQSKGDGPQIIADIPAAAKSIELRF